MAYARRGWRACLDSGTAVDPSHFRQSSYREALVEHLFLGELLRRLWVGGVRDLEVLKPQVDDAGYDLVLVRRLDADGGSTGKGLVTRYLQLKASGLTGATGSVTLHRRLAERAGGCLVWVLFEPELFLPGDFRFRWFGGSPFSPPVDRPLRPARHPITKAERLNVLSVPRSLFVDDLNWEELLKRLFPDQVGDDSPARARDSSPAGSPRAGIPSRGTK